MKTRTKQKSIDHTKNLVKAFQNGIRHAINNSWNDVKKELSEDIYLAIDCNGETIIKVVDGATGEDWIVNPISDLIDREVKVWGDDPDFVASFEGMAEEFEKQAKRLRKLVKKTTAAYEKFQNGLYPELKSDEETIKDWQNG